MTPEQKDQMRECYRKNSLQLILLPEKSLREECPDLFPPPVARSNETPVSSPKPDPQKPAS